MGFDTTEINIVYYKKSILRRASSSRNHRCENRNEKVLIKQLLALSCTLFQDCFMGGSGVVRECYKGVKRMFQGCMGVTCHMCVITML